MSAKSSKKTQGEKFVTPFGTARFPKITKPDTDGKFPDNQFKTSLMLDDDEVDTERKRLQAVAKKFFPDVDVADIALPLTEHMDKDKDDKTKKVSAGWGFKAHSKKRPAVFDAKKNKLPEGSEIGGGSILRISGVLKPYTREEEQQIIEDGKKRKEKVTIHGLTFYLNGVQVKELNAGGTSDGSEFEEVEGFEYESDGAEQFDDAAGGAEDL